MVLTGRKAAAVGSAQIILLDQEKCSGWQV
jgi:hypothetical protein